MSLIAKFKQETPKYESMSKGKLFNLDYTPQKQKGYAPNRESIKANFQYTAVRK